MISQLEEETVMEDSGDEYDCLRKERSLSVESWRPVRLQKTETMSA